MIPNDEHRGTERGAPDFTGSVMSRLGYRQASGAEDLRAMRRRRACVMFAQGSLVLAACALGAAWWMGTAHAGRSQAAVGDALRGSVAQGAGRLDSIMLGMPRVPNSSPLQASESKQSSELPIKSIDGMPHSKTY